MPDQSLGYGEMKKYLCLIAGFLLAGDVLAGLYKCVDQQGHVHYTDRPQAGCDATKLTPSPAPDEEQVRQSRQRLEKRLKDLKRTEEIRREDKEREQKAKTEAERLTAKRQRECGLAQKDLRNLKMQRPVYTVDDKGERNYLDDAARKARIERLEAFVGKYCSKH
jgi:hypothetical protein